MDITVKNLKVRKSPNKVRPLLSRVMKMNCQKAVEILNVKADSNSILIKKLILSGIAAAKDKESDEKALYIKSLRCDKGQNLKRYRFGSRGRISKFKKHFCHITLTISDDTKSLKTNRTTKEPRSKKGKNGSKN